MNAFLTHHSRRRAHLASAVVGPNSGPTSQPLSRAALGHRAWHSLHRLGVYLRLNAPITLLLALLQRTPMDRIATVTVDTVVDSPIGALLRAGAIVATSLEAIDSMAGATTLLATSPSPYAATVGTNLSIGFTVTNTINIGSWKVTGSLPPGTQLSAKEGGNTLTGPGTLDATTPGMSDGYGGTTGANSTTTPLLTGAPTTSGTYTFSLQAFEFGALGGLASNTFSYTINVTGATSTNTAPTVTDPQSQSVSAGTSVTFTVTATGSPAPTYQWNKDGAAIAGATNASLTIGSAQTTDAGTYTATVTNPAGTATSHGATLTVAAPVTVSAPVFTFQPTSQTIATGSTVTFNATATSATAYQWQLNSVAIAGATDSLLVIANAGAANAGTYSVVASNSAGSVVSANATLTVKSATAAEIGHITNLSVRTYSGTNDQVLNVGFVIGGANTTGSKPLLVRVTGPALVPFGVSGTMADPTLTMQPLGSPTIIASNDNWGGDSSVSATEGLVGAFRLTDPNSTDAALVTSLSGGTYTAIAGGKNNGTGIVLTEVYDATDSATITSTTPRLINVSARAQVGTGDAVLIAGFTIAGSTSKTVLIRATGPALAGFGVSGTLADPILQLYALNGPKLFENDNWGGSTVIANVGQHVGAFTITDPNSTDSVLLITLAPGGYTAEVSGAHGGTGVSLVEVYDVP